jgi:hypothetical protein
MHSDSYQKEEFRLSWFTITSLLRSIGHVLENVDKNLSPELERIIKDKWTETQKTKPAIFWDFIKPERDRFLKEYNHSVDRSISWEQQMGSEGPLITISIKVGDSQNSYIGKPSQMKSIINSGRYKGRNEKEVAVEALNWWEGYIEDIKKRLGK